MKGWHISNSEIALEQKWQLSLSDLSVNYALLTVTGKYRQSG